MTNEQEDLKEDVLQGIEDLLKKLPPVERQALKLEIIHDTEFWGGQSYDESLRDYMQFTRN